MVSAPAALAGVTVLDLATFLAAPVCATLLGEFGADVIKVEQPGIGDRWHLGWDDLWRVRASLVMVRISAYGQTGPRRDRPGFGRIAAAAGGLAYLSGYPDRPPVSPGTPTVPDYLAGVFGAVGALVALRHAERTGRGQVVDLGLYEPVLRILDDAIPVYGGTGAVRERIGSGTESAVPHDHYRTRDGRFIAIACTNDRMFERLLRAMAREDLLGDPRMATTRARLEHRAVVDDLVAAWCGARDAAAALAVLGAAEVPASPVMSVRDLFEDAQVRARENILRLAGLAMPGVIPRLDATPGRVEHPGPAVAGQDNEEIYGGRLGIGKDELARLRERGVI
ncbi:MAG: CoA transferase [Candidatus Rokubacteria bacterium]|nr:CoA transferase [Candidatus Rokubacteria bacterium]